MAGRKKKKKRWGHNSKKTEGEWIKCEKQKLKRRCLSRTQGSLLPVPTERRVGERTCMRTRLRRFEERNCAKLRQTNKQKTTELL